MRDRLIELIMECNRYTPENSEPARLHAEFLAQHLLNNNVIVLPCKLNSKVYDISEFVDKHPHPDIYEFITDDIILSRCRKTKELIFSIDGIDYTFDEFGTSVFLSEKEAEKEASKFIAEKMELNRERYKRKCPFCGEICEGTHLVNLICKCGAKYYYESDVWKDRKTGKEVLGDLWHKQ